MHSQTMTANAFAGGESEGNVRGWVVFAGIAMLVLGTAAVIYDVTATIVSVVLFGWLLVIAGVMQIVHAFQVRTWSGFFLYLLDGILRATVGTLLVVYPGSGALTLTLLLSFYFIVGGVFKTIGSIVLQFPSWGVECGVRAGVGGARGHARDAVAQVGPLVHRFRRRPRPDSVRVGAFDVRCGDQEALTIILIGMESLL